MIIFALVRLVFGFEVVSFDGEHLKVERKIGPITIHRPKTFSVAHIRDVELEERISKLKGRPTADYAITFEYMGHRQELLDNLGEQQADSLLNASPLTELVKQSHIDK